MQIGALTPKADAKVRTSGETAKLSREKFQKNMKVFAFLDKTARFYRLHMLHNSDMCMKKATEKRAPPYQKYCNERQKTQMKLLLWKKKCIFGA